MPAKTEETELVNVRVRMTQEGLTLDHKGLAVALCRFALFADTQRDDVCNFITATFMDMRGNQPLDV
jgi:hypothetical protein